ncbi:helix-turn-helix transcriptional regulator [Pseudohalioglobus sediminis]|uniref:Helix-turn-helix transcriptional regulator n=1 Tax=Pseudohalioglobus sediminis TaxID=2606449 RepID=A0A5B0X6E3_9GAMM|nr:helix-turn-helix transcriptional regulator [Pseudohalioglobus sediminis]KAA1193901.1 helix-turn-helix transcriptional regulator [Pseudohalioglobus sediminis]
MAKDDQDHDTLIASLRRLTGQVAGSTFELAKNTATMTAMFGETWLRTTVLNQLEPERLEAMAEAGHFLRDARETAGLSIKELSESLGLSDNTVLEDIERGQTIMPLELMLRAASLLARHDPIPFLIKFMRTYNPALEQTLEQLGVLTIPKQYERERRFVNLYRQHDVLRQFSDDEFARYIHYMESSSNLVLDVMAKEKAANEPRRSAARSTAGKKRTTRSKAAAPKKTPAKKKAAPKRKRAPAAKRKKV